MSDSCFHHWVYADEDKYIDPKAKPCKDFDRKYSFLGRMFYCKYCRKVVIEESRGNIEILRVKKK